MNRQLILPREFSEDLAEFFGILTGDGFISFYPSKCDYVIEICGHSNNDYEYLTNYVTKLIKKLFDISPKIYIRKDQNCLYVRVRSKVLYYYLRSNGFPTGKKSQISIPSWIYQNENFMLAFIRGFTDTDGCLTYRKEYPIIKVSSISEILIRSTANFLLKQGFYLCKYKECRYDPRIRKHSVIHKIQISGVNNLKLWLSIISFGNSKHLKKLKMGRGGLS